MKKQLQNILIITIIFGLLDQLTKLYARLHFIVPFEIIPDFFSLNYRENYGIAFSIDIPRFLIIFLTYIFLFFGIYLAYKELNIHKKTSQILLGLIIGGSIGNLIDRSTYGYVIDFIDIWRWPVFNLADMGIVIGILGIILFYGKIKRTNNK